MKNTSIAKIIRTNHVNAKFWFAEWSKNRCADIQSKIAHALTTIKEMIAQLFAEGVDADDRADLAAMQADLNVIAAKIGN